MIPRAGDMTLSAALKFFGAIDRSVGMADQDCDCEYCMSDKMHVIDTAKKLQRELVALGWTPPEPLSSQPQKGE